VKHLLPLLFLLLVAAVVAQALWQHDRLPERVATHFDAAGRPDGWMSRDNQTKAHLGLVLFIAGLLEGLARLSPRLPDALVNLPRRDHWLAPERRAATHAWIAGLVRLLGCVLIGFFLALFHLVYRANLSSTPMLTAPVGLLGGGLLATVGLILAGVLLRFARPPA
jgi:Protein of unknown function (DUF1648)